MRPAVVQLRRRSPLRVQPAFFPSQRAVVRTVVRFLVRSVVRLVVQAVERPVVRAGQRQARW